MFLQVAGSRSSISAKITWISYTFMLWFFMWPETTEMSSSVLTLVTGVSYTFILGFFMSLEMSDCRSRVLTLVTRIYYPFMLSLSVTLEVSCPGSNKITFITLILRSLCCINRWCWIIWISLNNIKILIYYKKKLSPPNIQTQSWVFIAFLVSP